MPTIIRNTKRFFALFLVLAIAFSFVSIIIPVQEVQAVVHGNYDVRLESALPSSVKGKTVPGDYYRIPLPNFDLGLDAIQATRSEYYAAGQAAGFTLNPLLAQEYNGIFVDEAALNIIYNYEPFRSFESWAQDPAVRSALGNTDAATIANLFNVDAFLSYLYRGRTFDEADPNTYMSNQQIKLFDIIVGRKYWDNTTMVSLNMTKAALVPSSLNGNMGQYMYYGPISVSFAGTLAKEKATLNLSSTGGVSFASAADVKNSTSGGSKTVEMASSDLIYLAWDKNNKESTPPITVNLTASMDFYKHYVQYYVNQGSHVINASHIAPGLRTETVSTDGSISFVGITGTVNIRAIDSQNSVGLSGAKFKIESVSIPGWTPVDMITTATNGAHTQIGIPPGEFKVSCIEAPIGYEAINPFQNFTMSLTGGILTIDYMFQPVKMPINIELKSSGGTPSDLFPVKPIEGAVFQILQEGKLVDTLVTDKDGKAQGWYYKGTYQVRQVYTPDPYYLNTEIQTAFLAVDAGSVYPWRDGVTQYWTNVPKAGMVNIIFLDAETLSGVPYCKFDLFDSMGTLIKSYNLGTMSATTIKLPYGRYTLVQTASSDGYLYKTTAYDIYVEGGEGGKAYTILNSRKKATITVYAGDDNLQPVAGATFTLRKGGVVVGDFTTDAAGYLQMFGLPTGSYTVEIKSLPDYLRMPEIYWQDVTILENGEVVLAEFKDLVIKKQILEIYNYWQDYTGPLISSKWEVRRIDGTLMGTLSTNIDGKASMTLPYGKYFVKQITPAVGFEKDTTVREAMMDWLLDVNGQLTTIRMEIPSIRLTGSSRIVTTDAFGRPIAGAVYNIYYDVSGTDADPLVASSLMSDSNGVVYLPQLELGNYKALQISVPSPYIKSGATYYFSLTSSVIPEVVYVYNNTSSISVSISKKDSITKEAIPGATFGLFQYELSLTPVMIATTNSNGVAVFQNVPNISGYFREISPAPGYLLNKTLLGWYDSEAAVAGVTLKQIQDAWILKDSGKMMGVAYSFMPGETPVVSTLEDRGVITSNAIPLTESGPSIGMFDSPVSQALTFNGSGDYVLDADGNLIKVSPETPPPTNPGNGQTPGQTSYDTNFESEGVKQTPAPSPVDRYLDPYQDNNAIPHAQTFDASSYVYNNSRIRLTISGLKTGESTNITIIKDGVVIAQRLMLANDVLDIGELYEGNYQITASSVEGYTTAEPLAFYVGYYSLLNEGCFVFAPANTNSVSVRVYAEDSSSTKGITVALLNSKGKILEKKKTNSKGVVIFESVEYGAYSVEALSDIDGLLPPETEDITVSARRNSVKVELEYTLKSGNIQGSVFWDKNYDGIKDSSDIYIRNAKVTLEQGGYVVAAGITDAYGSYQFYGLPAGVYNLKIGAPAGYKFSTPSKESSAYGNYVSTSGEATITVSNGSSVRVDAGMFLATGVVLPNTGIDDLPELVTKTIGSSSGWLMGLGILFASFAAVCLAGWITLTHRKKAQNH